MKADILTLVQILDYCDEPQVFSAKDNFGTLFLCLAIDEDEKYVAIKISEGRLFSLKNQEIDLRETFINSEEGIYYIVNIKDGVLKKQCADFMTIPEDYLPDTGYYILGLDSDTYTVKVPKSDNTLFKNLIKKFGWVAM